MKLSVIANPEKYAIKEPFRDLLKWAREHEVPCFFEGKLAPLAGEFAEDDRVSITPSEADAVARGDIVVAIGGDGTMLYTARLSKESNKPILGVNSGRLGFMANTQKDNITQALDYVKKGEFKTDRRTLFEAKTSDGATYHALNEFLFSKKDTASMIKLTAEYGEELINRYWADGLIVATPTGSTAYNLSSSGPIIMPDTNVMVLTPINPHTLTTRPLVLPSDKPLKMTIEEQKQEVLFSYDGIMIDIDQYPFEVQIQRSQYAVDLIELPFQSYFETLRNKLMWGKDYRDQV